jgi:PST family polysaccharide transporter
MNVLSGIVKMKAAAVLLGPIGVGLIGIYMNLMQTAASVAALGLGTAGTRQIAAARAENGDDTLGQTRRALFWLTLILATLGGGVFWLLSGWIARVVLDNAARSADVAWMALGVALTVASGSQVALLTGLRRVSYLAFVTVASSLSGTLFGLCAIWLWGTKGVVGMVIAGPLATFLVGHILVARLGPASGPAASLSTMVRQSSMMIRLGIAFMVSGIVTLLGQLAVRILVQRELGLEALGYFQAAWTIGMTYLGFVLGAMGTDYYPRLTAAIEDRETAVRLVNEQIEIGLLLCAPVLLAMLGSTHWVIRLLYSSEFGPTIEIMRWQLLGDILKVMSWPLGYLILARGAGKTFVIAESLGIGTFVAVTWIGLPIIGVTATGVGFLAMYAIYLPFVGWVGAHSIGFRFSGAVLRQGRALAAVALCTVWIASINDTAGAAAGVLFAITAGAIAIIVISRHVTLRGRLGRVQDKIRTLARWRG